MIRVVLVSAFHFALCSSVLAQASSAIPTQFPKSVICGTVRDEPGGTVPRAMVEAKLRKESKAFLSGRKNVFTIITDAKGSFSEEIPDGIYDLTFRANSFRSYKIKRYVVPSEPRECIEMRLKSAVPPHQIT